MTFKTNKTKMDIQWNHDPLTAAVQYRDLVVAQLHVKGYTLERRESSGGTAFYTIQRGIHVLGTLTAHTRQRRNVPSWACEMVTAAVTVEWSKSLGISHGARSITWCQDAKGADWQYRETLDQVVDKIDTIAKKILDKVAQQDQVDKNRRASADLAREITKAVECPEGVVILGTDDPKVLTIKVQWTGQDQDVARMALELSRLIRAYNRPEEW